MGAFDIDTREVLQLASDLGKVAGRMVPAVDEVMEAAALRVEVAMREDAEGSRYFRGIAPTITHDRAYGLGSVGYEVGPDRDMGGQAQLAGIAYFGGVHGGGGTLDIDGPLTAEERRLLAALGDLGDLV